MARERRRTLDEAARSSLVQRALDFYEQDTSDRGLEMDARAQRYAKFRQWRDDTATSPWEGASDVQLGDLMRASLRMQDTLYNAVISTRPVMLSKATSLRDKQKQEAVDDILDHQAFVENKEGWVSDIVDAFVNDGHFTAFIPWVRDNRLASITTEFPPIPEEADELDYFQAILTSHFASEEIVDIAPRDNDGWAWTVLVLDEFGREDAINVDFWTGFNEKIEMVVTRSVNVFDGPKIHILDRADVLHPVWAANLQPPSPSNPQGASHVILVSRPTVDEIRRLQALGVYDLLSEEDANKLIRREADMSDHPEEVIKDVMEGHPSQPNDRAREHRPLTRLMVFDVMDIDGNGVTEDIVYWVLKEDEKLLAVRRLNEAFPNRKARRPLAEEQFIPVRGRRTGIGMLEITEPSQDQKKMIADLLIDSLSMALTPFGFYRPTSTMNPEMIRLSPGELYPLNDPANDINFPNISMVPASMGLNVLTYMSGEQEKLTMQNALNFGQVPRGKASALRTAGSTAMIAGQGEARPERILRRFFHGISGIFNLMHEANVHYLDNEKVFKVSDAIDNKKMPYRKVRSADLDGVFEFEFRANAFNTSKQLLQDSLMQIGSVVASPLSIQLGTVTPTNIYNWQREMIKSWGQEPDKYLTAPVPMPLISVEDALISILNNEMPRGYPAEGTMPHLERLQEFQLSDNFGYLQQEQLPLFEQWVQTVLGYLQQEQETQALAAAAAEKEGSSGPGRPPQDPGDGNPPVQENELLDESLPGAGGGAAGQ